MDIKKLRHEAKKTQADIAMECGVSVMTVQSWEKGTTRNIKPKNMEKLRVALGLKGHVK